MGASLPLLALALTGCITTDPDCGALVEQSDERRLDLTLGQFWMNTAAAEKGCHAQFQATIGYPGDDATDPDLPRPSVDVSANAVGINGEQPGLLGVLLEWALVEDPETGERWWFAELGAGAKNIDAPAVSYGMAAVLQPGEARAVDVWMSIGYVPAAPDAPTEGNAATGCR